MDEDEQRRQRRIRCLQRVQLDDPEARIRMIEVWTNVVLDEEFWQAVEAEFAWRDLIDQ